MIHVRIGADDVATYGHADWLPLDTRAVDDLPLAAIAAYEQQIGPFSALMDAFGDGSDVARAGLLWLARWLAGIDTVPFLEFQVRPRRIEVESRPTAGYEQVPATKDA